MRSLAIILLWFFVSNVYAVHFAAPEDNDESCSFWWGPSEKNAAPINEDARIVREPTQTADGSTMRFTKEDIEGLLSLISCARPSAIYGVEEHEVLNFPFLFEAPKDNPPDFSWPPHIPPFSHGTR